MEPYLFDGDHVLTFNWIGAKAEDVIVYKKGDDFWIKRIKRLAKNKVYLAGDNRKLSSRIGPIEKETIVGKVILKY